METTTESRMAKNFAVFDCDAHINDPPEIWDEYVPVSEKAAVEEIYPREMAGSGQFFAPFYNPITIAGPQMSKKIIRRLIAMVPLTEEQRDYLDHKGAYDPHARVEEMDQMGIDQVLVNPTGSIAQLPHATNPLGVAAFCRAYNNWLRDWCAEEPGRLFGAALVPWHDPAVGAQEVQRIAELGHPVGLIRPIEGTGGYPNKFVTAMPTFGFGRFSPPTMDAVYRAFEDTGVCLGMHTFPGGPGSPGYYLGAADVDSQTLSFVFEAQAWLGQVLLSGFLDRYPRLKMLIFESNSEWLPYLLATCDRLFKLYKKERRLPAKRLPSEAFYDQCAISFESDEVQTFRQWRRFENIGIWASDCYHHDAADAWSAIRAMREDGVPEEVQANLMGANARRFYGIEPKLFVTEEPDPLERPDWFPQGPEFEEWASLVAHPRENAARLRELGMDSPFAAMAASFASSSQESERSGAMG